LGCLLSLTLQALSIAPSGAGQAGPVGNVGGKVLSAATGRPVAGALVLLSDFGVHVTTGRDGSFAFPKALPTDSPYRRIQAVVTAPGFGPWTITGVPLYPNDTLRLHVELRRYAWEHRVLTPEERRATPAPSAPDSSYIYTCTGWAYQLVPTQNIKVRITEENVSTQYDFAFYASHVLPNEWIPSWDADSLAAGAIAVKTYAGYRAMPGHAYSEGEDCADIVDTTADQVFDPTWSNAATDQAVNATMGSVSYKNGGLYLSQYYAGAEGDPCAPVEGQFAGRMSQWGTKTCADDGVLWPEIVTTFYPTATWRYLLNLVLNPNVESAGTYAWKWTGTATRTKGGAFNGNWYWQMAPPSGKRGSLREIRPFDGTEDTTYHAEAALRCGPENGTDCSVTLWVVVWETDGTTHSQPSIVTVPNDSLWHPYTFDTAPAGYDHYQVKLGINTPSTIGVDGAVLTSAYGGP